MQLDNDPALLVSHIARSNAKQLGRYAEALWQFWFATLPGTLLHAAGLPVKDGLAVRGEFDFVVCLPGLDGIQHLEMAYKFFLHHASAADLARCVGPNPADTLDRKWRHMIDVQLPLSQTALGRAALPDALALQAITPRACLQGYIFYPFGDDVLALPAVAPDHARGWWSRFEQGSECPSWMDIAQAWTISPKLRWIAPAFIAAHAPLPMTSASCHAHLQAHFAMSRQAQLLCGLARNDKGQWHETVRVFVVHPDWPSASADGHA
jgi:hypothetical protein